jgi:hypothetical protein
MGELEAEVVDAVVAEDARSPQGVPCPSCGCPVEPADRFCPACGTAQSDAQRRSDPARRRSSDLAETGSARRRSPDLAEPSTESLPEPASESAVEEHKYFRCSNCGSQMAADPDQRSYICPFCDSTYVVEFSPEQTGRQPPEFIIGFAVTREQAQEIFYKWIRTNSWIRPSDLATQSAAEKQRGVYLPFWSFSMLAESSWSASIGEHWYRTETYTTTDAKGKVTTHTRQVQETEWWPLSGRHHHFYSGYLVSGSRGLPQKEAQRIFPFNLPALRRYEPYYLAGWLSEEYSVSRDDALQASFQEFQRREQTNIAAFLPGDTHSNLNVSTQFDHINSDLCLLPVYILSYRYRGKLYRFLVNGQTGKCDGNKPLSWKRILSIVVGVAALVAIVVLIIVLMNR